MTSKIEHGDIVKVAHSLYDHYGVYVKTPDGPHIIHYTGENGPKDFNGIVRETPISVFLNGETKLTVCKFNPKKCRTVYSGKETAERAKSRVGQRGYNILTNNCEHFAIWCKTGEEKSSQVRDLSYGILFNVFSFLEEVFS